ncbi:hypothetical protein PanWU01x14_309800, partial [Parasponia andersonii]
LRSGDIVASLIGPLPLTPLALGEDEIRMKTFWLRYIKNSNEEDQQKATVREVEK